MEEYLSIGTLAKLSEVSIQRIRYYDKIGLFIPIWIDEESKYRYYSHSQLDKLNIIQSLQYVGFSLKEIKAYFVFNDVVSLQTLFEEKLRKINEKEEELTRKKDILHTYVEVLAADTTNAQYETIFLPRKEVYICVKEEISTSQVTAKHLINKKMNVYHKVLEKGFSKSSWIFIFFCLKEDTLYSLIQSNRPHEWQTLVIEAGDYVRRLCHESELIQVYKQMRQEFASAPIFLEEVPNLKPAREDIQFRLFVQIK